MSARMAGPFVTALITCYDYGRFVGEAIESALTQTHVPLEVVVVDDGSTDETPAVLRSFGDRVRAIAQQNRGQAAAFNTGIAAARGEIICFLDADDTWSPGKVAAVVAKYAAGASGLVCHDLDVRPEPGMGVAPQRWSALFEVTLREGDLAPWLVENWGWPFPPTSGLSMPAALARRVAPIPEAEWRLCADNPLAYGAAWLAPVTVIPEVLGTYRLHGANGFLGAQPVEVARKLCGLDHPLRRLAFLKAFAQRHGGPLAERVARTDLFADYRFLRPWCFIAAPFPLAHLARLARATAAHGRRRGDGWMRIVATAARDALIAAVISLGIPSRYSAVRRHWRARAGAPSP